MNKSALLSVSDKTGITEFAEALAKHGYTILATGKTAALLRENKIDCTEVSDLTGFPEVFGGRLKTLHPKVMGGILFRRDNVQDVSDAESLSIPPIDIVCVNLYPFEETAKKREVSLNELIEQIDIGGPSLIRAAAKNHKHVAAVTDSKQYEKVIEEVAAGGISLETRSRLAMAAFGKTAQYDTVISSTLSSYLHTDEDYFRLLLPKTQSLRYGENPHQNAALFGSFNSFVETIHGKELSYNNILDIVAAVELTEEFEEPFCAIIKHNCPCGAALGETILEAYTKALASDPVSAFGGIVSFNREVTEDTAAALNQLFLEVIVAPSYSEGALELLRKKRDRRIVRKLKPFNADHFIYRSIPGGILLQSKDEPEEEIQMAACVTKKSPEPELASDLSFVWKIVKHCKSNAIVFAKEGRTLGIGAGQVSRIDSVNIAIMKAKERGFELHGSVVGSDAYFPFADNIETIAAERVAAVIQPGGSVRDAEVIAAADTHDLAMVFTHKRHFKH